jgi:hypothetical protein
MNNKQNKQEQTQTQTQTVIAIACIIIFVFSALSACFGQAPNVTIGESTIYIVFDQQGDEGYADAVLNTDERKLLITLFAKDQTEMQVKFEDVIIEWPDEYTVTAHTGKYCTDFFEIHTDTGAAYWRNNGRTSGFIQKFKNDK